MHYESGNNSLNKQQWNHDGSKLAVGDSQGTVQILSLDKRALKINQDKLNNAEAFVRSKK